MNTTTSASPIIFNEERASAYDQQFAKVTAMKDALHLCMRFVLADLSNDAHILCVGAGTGAELIELAKAFPNWQFTVVEPAIPMLDICRRRIEELGMTARCTFHAGYLDTLPKTVAFDAATLILVSHFLTELEERRNLFREIAVRLRPGGYLVSADLVSDSSTPASKKLFEVWIEMLKYSGLSDEQIENYGVAFKQHVAALPPREVEKIIMSSGFEAPVLFCQTLLIHAWYAKLSA